MPMTLAARNKTLITGIIFSFLFLIGIGIVVFFIFADNLLANKPLPEPFFQWVHRLPFYKPSNMSILISIVFFAFFVPSLLAYTYLLFEKTHAIEISFFALFIFTLSFEGLRLLFPFYPLRISRFISIAGIARIVIFFRFLEILSLLTSSLFANRIMTRETTAIGFLICCVAFSIAHALPVNTYGNTSVFFFSYGYEWSTTIVFAILCLLSVISYYLIGKIKDIKEYKLAALALLVLLSGYALLLTGVSWFAIIFGIVLFASSSIFFIKKIHEFYLWQ
ncbi:hypothetical protein HMPREF9554_02385 [Treponema phagedenis F0421]|nr:hypothetical protein HMPREF9554_02385 [Treponema phagedenis F0421]